MPTTSACGGVAAQPWASERELASGTVDGRSLCKALIREVYLALVEGRDVMITFTVSNDPWPNRATIICADNGVRLTHDLTCQHQAAALDPDGPADVLP